MDKQIVGFLAIGFTYTTALVDYLVYQPDAAREAAAAGYILLSMVMVSTSSGKNDAGTVP